MHHSPTGFIRLLFFIGQHILILKSLHLGKLIQPPHQKDRQHSKQELQGIPDPRVVNNISVLDDSLNVLRLRSKVLDKIYSQEVHQDKVHNDVKLV